MPELPEVETVTTSLRPYVIGKKITAIDIRKDKSFPDAAQRDHILNQEITRVWRRAKLIIMDLANDYHLVTHLKMTGQLLYQASDKAALAGGGHPTRDVREQLPGKHTRVILHLDDGSTLYFNDLRIFGWLRIMDAATLAHELAKYGPDANAITDPDSLHARLARCSRPIKQVLMDNQYLSGIGNIYAAEICYACRLDPRTPAKAISREQVSAIAAQAHTILTAAIAAGGTTFDGRYVDADGQGGNFEAQLSVYGRAGQACRRCGETLVSCKIAGRSTVYCPGCQR